MQVRPLTKEEMLLIVSYFFSATAIFLKGMGANPDKLPNELKRTQKIDLPLEEKKLFYFLWIHNHKHVGHSNLPF